MDREARGGSIYEIRTWWQLPGMNHEVERPSARCRDACNRSMRPAMCEMVSRPACTSVMQQAIWTWIAHDPLSFEHIHNTSKSVQNVREKGKKESSSSDRFRAFKAVFENSYSADFESSPGEGSRYLEVGSWQEAGVPLLGSWIMAGGRVTSSELVEVAGDCLGWDSEGLYLLVGDCNSLSNARLLTPHSLLFSALLNLGRRSSRRSCSCLIVGPWFDLCLERFGGVTEVMANRGTGNDGRGRIWGEGMDWTGGGLGYRSDQDNGNDISEMFGHDRNPLKRTRSFHVYGNRTRVREDSMASISPSRNWDRRHQHDQSVQ
ncbi:hypothetical protein F2Q70_00025618 [Brassica cretica]|uniref:Uncharacterized protein n=1 Tax=Brassica cretica TaxID=69181 RepID=A0A8S9L9Z2_BRACR|nr:hypothetical protein F2Q70_00025618 [Brassica cretica]